MPYTATDWRFTDSNGIDVSILVAGASMQSFYFRQGAEGQIWQKGIGCLSANLGLGLDFGLSVSPRSLYLPSAMLGPIYRTARVGRLQERHFGGNWMILSIGVGALMSGSLSMVLFGAPSKAAVVIRLATMSSLVVAAAAIGMSERAIDYAFRQVVDQFNGFGFVAGTAIGINLGAGISSAVCVTPPDIRMNPWARLRF